MFILYYWYDQKSGTALSGNFNFTLDQLWAGPKLVYWCWKQSVLINSWIAIQKLPMLKMITSEIVVFEAKCKNFFVLWKSHFPFLRLSFLHFKLFHHRWQIWYHDVLNRVHFWMYLLNLKSCGYETWPMVWGTVSLS